MNNTTKLVSGLVLIIVMLAGGYFLLQQSDGALVSSSMLPGGGIGQSTSSPEIDLAQDQTLQRLNRLEDIDINADFLSAGIFESFESFGISIQSQPVGRDNPFSPSQVSEPAEINGNTLDFSAESQTQTNATTSPNNTTSSATTSVDDLQPAGTTSTQSSPNQTN